jgi:uncharacterized membrane protein YuzA (DUF378 family)
LHFRWTVLFALQHSLTNQTKDQFAGSHCDKVDSLWLFDFSSLALIIAGGFKLGLLGLFGWDAAAAIFGGHTKAAYSAVGISAVWQLLRQRSH